MKQTAVEWLERELKKIPFVNPKEVFEQAKEMENQQLMEADAKDSLYKTEISDEDIRIESMSRFRPVSYQECFEEGAKWYREQLKQRQ